MIIWSTSYYLDGGTTAYNVKTTQGEAIYDDRRIGTKTPGRLTWRYPTDPDVVELNETEVQEFKDALLQYLERECYRVDRTFKAITDYEVTHGRSEAGRTEEAIATGNEKVDEGSQEAIREEGTTDTVGRDPSSESSRS